MAQRMSLDKLDRFLTDARGKVDAVARELHEVQVEFVSAHETSKAAHDSTLTDLSDRAAHDLGALPADVRQAVDERLIVERKTLEERRQELAELVVPETEKIADDLLARAQQETENMRKLNPRLDEQEERLKSDRVEMEAALNRLNAEIKQLSGCLTMFVNYFKINKLDRQRHELQGRMEENARALRQVREEWDETKSEYLTEDAELEREWRQANVDAARSREELAQLNDDARREDLALHRAIFYVFDNWKTPLSDGADGSSLVDAIDQMVELNIQTDTYEEGLGKVAGLIALLTGTSQGLQSMGQSVQALIKEQKMHSAHLRPISVNVTDDVIEFHRPWDDLRDKLEDEKSLTEHPAEFSALFDEEMAGSLAEENITRMFDSLSDALQTATRDWRG